MPDHPMTPDPFREALDNLVWAASMLQGSASPLLLSARAEVERLYAARVGEEYEVQTVRPEEFNVWEDGTREYYPDLVLRGPNPLKVEEGARVFVTKGEAG